MRVIGLLFYLLVILLGISFSALNATKVLVNFYFTTINVPISVLTILTLGLGVIIGFLLFVVKYWKLKIVNAQIKKQLKLTEHEIKNLRTIPIRNEDSVF